MEPVSYTHLDVYKRQVYEGIIELILESREVAKKDKAKIMSGLSQYAKFGENSRFRDVISEQRLHEINVEELTEKVRNLLLLPYEIFFYGKDFEAFKTNAETFVEATNLKIPEPKIFSENTTESKVFFTDYDMAVSYTHLDVYKRQTFL